MKIRSGFVSNSSSSSFIINKAKLSDEQIYKIRNHIQEAIKVPNHNKLFDYVDKDDAWNIVEEEGFIEVSTNIDNFDMEAWLEYIGLEYEENFLSIE